jgi:hypothetical protein
MFNYISNFKLIINSIYLFIIVINYKISFLSALPHALLKECLPIQFLTTNL